MGHLYQLFQIEIPTLHLDFVKSYMRHWVLIWILILPSTHKLMDNPNDWEEHFPLVEFSYNNSFQSSIQMAPYEALYGRKFRAPLCWTKLGERKVLGPKVVQESEGEIKLIQDKLKAASDSVRDQVLLKVSPWGKVLRFGRKGKLSPRIIRPYKILKRVGLVAYKLELPPKLDRIHDVLHVSMLI
ncbi:DNA/RNA polymerase superfamily protein [Gossypium australe]|uniref:DNA/RNA polymerase superfamily protein n=1 Tax=Gossypium australe TaxID=47621 RepID=A0A5B6V9R1_9ROSI|nr:DNA/RNA polymerase superfamily protein [Gossypium australe]